MRVLVVEDEQKVANALREGLEGERYEVVVERTGEGAFFRVTTETFDVILLDLGLPGRSGLEILGALRERGLKTPVLVLTARDSVQDRVLGLDGGADGDLDMDLVTRKVVRSARPIDLTVREFELLEYLLRHHGQVVSREALARDVWRETARTTPLDNVIDVHIARLRRKVDVEPAVKLIHTVRGVGFMLREGEP
jgi:DNA-binding response OmpR family regulator